MQKAILGVGVLYDDSIRFCRVVSNKNPSFPPIVTRFLLCFFNNLLFNPLVGGLKIYPFFLI